MGIAPLQRLSLNHAGSQPHGMVACDLNGDGILDLAVAIINSGTVSILFSMRGGDSLIDAVNYNVGFGPNAMCAATST